MPTFKDRSVLSGMTVSQAMNQAVICVGLNTSVSHCIRLMIKARADALLVEGDQGTPDGVVSKTDIMGAFYGGMSREVRAGEIMAGPVRTCAPYDGLDKVLDTMKTNGIHQVFVRAPMEERVAGKLEYSDIAGLIYRYCRRCKKGCRHPEDLERDNLPRLLTREVMTGQVQACKGTDTLYQVMELLSLGKLKAVPIVDDSNRALGVISKTDLILAYARDVSPDSQAVGIMNSPVVSCGPDEQLSKAILKMFLTDIQHLFVTAPLSGEIKGVVSLSDAARFRSGTCRACSASRGF